jgi:gliding motility-associated-like protein
LGLAQTINVQSVSTARQTGGDNGYTLNGQWMVDSRSKLLNPSNFGPGGTYPKTINITDGYSTTGSLTQISTVPTNAILFFGVFNLNDASTQPFTDAEIDSVYNWSIKGGKMIICADPNLLPTINYAILNAKWGFSLTPTSSVSLFPTPAGNASIIFNGPFGNVPSASEGGSLQGFFNSIPSNSIVLAREAYGNPTLYLDCNTLDLLAADVDVYSTLGGISTGNMINNNEDKFLANVFAYMDTMQDPPTIIKNGINLSCTSVYSKYQWYLNGDSITSATNQTYTVAQNGTYTVKAYLNCGCKVFSNEIAIDTSFLEDVLIIPNVFDPNNPDPVNQTFHVIGTGIKTLDFIVYDRWGEKVFETNDVNKGWEGTLDGEKLSTAVFVYYVKATFNDGKEIEKKGNVTLIR